MRRAWGVLALMVLAAALALAALRRAPASAPPSEPAAPPSEVVSLTIRIADGRIDPALAELPLGALWVVTRRNESARAHTLSLAGYEHALAPCTLAAGASRTDTVLLSLPGEDFAWLLDRQPAARLAVAGSHLVEGHR